MSLSSALYSGLTGLAANSQLLSAAGNNLANSGTTGYKAQELNFQTQISQTINEGTAPTTSLGGTNPVQIGLGTDLASTTTNFTAGSITSTGVPTDLALTGNGFFIVNSGGQSLYTRAGDFNLDTNQVLVDSNGAAVQGYGVNSNFNLVPGALTNLTIPVGTLTIADATQNVTVTGTLNAAGTVATTRSTTTGNELFSDSGATTPATGTTALDSLYNSSGQPVLPDGSVITITGATVGNTTLPTYTFQVGATNTTGSTASGTTYQDLANFLQSALGINTSISGDPAGVTITNGALTITGNDGTINDVTLTSGDISVSNAGTSTDPFTFTKTGTANGESTQTTVVAYDSLGDPDNVNLSFVLEGSSSTGTTWRYYATAADGALQDSPVGTGTVSFGTNGELLPTSNNTITLQFPTGAQATQTINLGFGGTAGLAGLSSFANSTSQIATADGAPVGTLQSFSVGNDGTITGTFSNSQTRTLGQVVLANFINPQGLAQQGDNDYSATPSSGTPSLVTAGTAGTGTITGEALEQSNVDLSQEFINLIAATTGYSAASRVITTGNTMIQELLTTIQ